MIQYGLISETDARTLEKTIDLICDEFSDQIVYVVEIGCYGGETGRGINRYISTKKRIPWVVGIDSGKDNEKVRFNYNHFIKGNSNEVYSKLDDNSQHLIFVDGDHSKIGVISDFFAYADKVKVGGYFCFHDTGKHIKPFKDFQHGDKNNPDAYISVRKALSSIQLIGDRYIAKQFLGWEEVFDEADLGDEGGGVLIFKKIS